jgi:hypothetical protein
MKINREELKRDLAEFKLLRCDDAGELHGENKTVYNAALQFWKMSDPKYVPTEEMIEAARRRDETSDLYVDIFRAMIAELVEG